MPNIRKKQTLSKTVMYLFKYPIMYIYQDILDAKKALFCVIKDCFSLNLKVSVIGLEEFNNLFSQFFPVHPIS